MHFISSFILKILGWKIEGEYPHHLKKLVVVVFHHTSNWDFPMGLMLRAKMKFNANFVGKSSLFKPPYGFLFRWLGGYPVERDPRKKKISLTDSIIELYNKEDEMTITFTPEGTRSKVRTLKTGFWIIASKAKVPILYINFDFSKKVFTFSETHYPAPTFREEYDMLKEFFKESKGFNPELSFDFEDNDMVFKDQGK